MKKKNRAQKAGSVQYADVSVIIPAYNAAETLERALVSVFTQTLRPYEVILIDDGSIDDSTKIISDIAERYPEQPLLVIKHDKNMGVSAARNSGWDAASGRYIAFLDADDAWHPEKLRIQYGWMQKHLEIDVSGHLRPKVNCICEIDIDKNNEKIIQPSKISFLLSNKYATSAVMMKRDLPYRFEEGKQYSEDYYLWLKVMYEGANVALILQPLGVTFKPIYGYQGLAADLWKMELGELDTYQRLHKEGFIGVLMFVGLGVYSLGKYMYRTANVFLRKGFLLRGK